MNILICISHVPDTTTQIKFTEDGKALDKNGVSFVINPYDEFGLSRALELKEAGLAQKVDVVSVGEGEVDATLRKALAVGADEAFHINALPADAAFVSKQLAEFIKTKDYKIIFTGKESIDSNGSEVPMMVAELLDLPAISFTTKLDVENDKVLAQREIQGGLENVESTMPVVVSCQKGIAEWRIAGMRGIMMAKRKPLNLVEAFEAETMVETEKYELPPAKSGCTYFESNKVEDLAKTLMDKGLI